MGRLRQQVNSTDDVREVALARQRADRCRWSVGELWAQLDAVGEALGWNPSVERALRFDASLRAALLARVLDTDATLDVRWAAFRVAERTVLAGDELGTSGLYEALLRTATAEERAEVYGRYGCFPGPAVLPRIAGDLRCPHAPTVRGALRTLDRLGADLSLTELAELEGHVDAEVAQLAWRIRFRRFPKDDEMRQAARDLLATENVGVATQWVRDLTAQRSTPKFVSLVTDAMLAFCLARLDRASPQVGISSDTWTLPLSFALYDLQRTGSMSPLLEAKLLDLAPRHPLHRHGLVSRAHRLGIAALAFGDGNPEVSPTTAGEMLVVVAEQHPEDAPLTLQRLAAMDWKLLGYRSAIRTCVRLGAEGRALLEARLGELPPEFRADALWRLAGHTSVALARRLDALGSLDPGWEGRLAPKAAAGLSALEQVLWAGKRATVFDREIGRIPVGHDGLLVQLARYTSGAVVPEAALERYLEDDDATEAYTVDFIVDDTLYSFQPRDLGDFYDVQAVVSALNVAVRNAGCSERLILLADGGQTASVLWLDETVARTIANEFDLGLFE